MSKQSDSHGKKRRHDEDNGFEEFVSISDLVPFNIWVDVKNNVSSSFNQ